MTQVRPDISGPNRSMMLKPAALVRDPLLTGPFAQLWFFNFITFFSAFQLFPTIPFRIMELGGSTAQAGFFLACYTTSCAFAAPVTGSLADHFGRRRMLLIASSAFVVFSILYGVITPLPLLLLVACVHGITWSAILSSGAAAISEVIPETRRSEGMGYWGMASTAAVAVSPLIGLSVYRLGWFWLCLEMASLSLVMLWMAARIPAAEPKSEGSLPRANQLIVWRVILLAMSLFAISFGYGGLTSYVAVMSRERGLEPHSIFFTAFAISIIATRLAMAPWADRVGPKALLYPSLAVIPFALATLAFANSISLVVIAAILFGAGFGGAYPGFVTYVLARSDPGRRAATFGSILFAFDTGIAAGSLVSGILAQKWGFEIAFLAAAAVAATAIPIFVVVSQRLDFESTPLEPAN